MNLFPLPVFPPASLDSSVITTVWVGVLVVTFFNLRFGWVFAGLVVPGYLVPLLLAKPISALVIVAEGVIAYGLVRLVSDGLPRALGWSSLFGRDRFFFIVVASVIVRLGLDGWALPLLGTFLSTNLGLSFDYRNELHSFGLVIVALLANHLWKPGLRYGLFQLVSTTAVTLILVRFVLMELTNFDLAAVDYLYEAIAASILASPKAYIILLTTAFIASRFNLLYGWEYSGILIPALLALQWYQPTKLLASFVEAWVILGVSQLLLLTPLFKGRTIEKASKIALFFTVSYFYKYILAFALLAVAPQVKVSDVYAFGYLLPSLLAVKMHDKHIGLRMTRFTVQTTVVAALASLLVGFSLTLLPRPTLAEPQKSRGPQNQRVLTRPGRLIDAVEEARVAIYRGRRKGSFSPPTVRELATFEKAVATVDRYSRDPTGSELGSSLSELGAMGFLIERVEDRFLLIREREPLLGWGFFVLSISPRNDLLIEVPRPLEEWATVQTAIRLFEELGARGLIVAGTSADANNDGSANALRTPETPFQSLHRLLSRDDVLQIRAQSEVVSRSLRGRARKSLATGQDPDARTSSLLVKSRLPPGLDLAQLESLVGSYQIRWNEVSQPNLQAAVSRAGFAELHLNRSARQKVLALWAEPEDEARTVSAPSLASYLRDRTAPEERRIARRGTDLYRPPRLEELLVFDDEVLQPIFEVTRTDSDGPPLSPRAESARRQAEIAANDHGYELVLLRPGDGSGDHLILQEADPHERYWGTFVFRLGPTRPFLVEVPRPLRELRSREVAVSLYQRLGASALLIGGSHPYANLDGSSDLLRLENAASVFTLVHQSLLREAGSEPRFVVVSRALDAGPESETQSKIALYDGSSSPNELDPLGLELLSKLADEGIRPVFVAGSRASAGYEVGFLPQARYLAQTENKSLAILWVSEQMRENYRRAVEVPLHSRNFTALGIPSVESDVLTLLSSADATERPLDDDGSLIRILLRYLETADVVTLRQIQLEWPWLGLTRVIDRNSVRDYLLLYDEQARLAGALNLRRRQADEPLILTRAQLPEGSRFFLDQRRSLLLVAGAE